MNRLLLGPKASVRIRCRGSEIIVFSVGNRFSDLAEVTVRGTKRGSIVELIIDE